MDNLLAKSLLVLGLLSIIGSFVVAWLIFALRDGPIGTLPFVFNSALLGIGVILLVFAKKTYKR